MRHRHPSERDQLELLRALPGDLGLRDGQDLMDYPLLSLSKTKCVMPIDFRAGAISIRVEAVPEHGMATIWDADVLIWAASQIVLTGCATCSPRDNRRERCACTWTQGCSADRWAAVAIVLELGNRPLLGARSDS
jgi:plasmid replication initiation protein